MIIAGHIQDSLFVDQANVTIPYSAKTLAINREIRRHSKPFSALKQGKFRKLFDRHSPALGYR